MKSGLIRWLAALGVCVAVATPAFAQTYTESGDAGQTLATAQVVPGGITRINGTLGVVGEVDLYKLTFSTSATITFHATSADDPNLILFDAAGHGLWGDDDSGAGPNDLDAEITWTVAPGTYYLAYGENNIEAANAANVEFCGNDSDNCSANKTDVLDHFNSSGDATGSYTITISSPTSGDIVSTEIPTLGEWAMALLSGLLLIGAYLGMRRRA
jgi:hypothetical protein